MSGTEVVDAYDIEVERLEQGGAEGLKAPRAVTGTGSAGCVASICGTTELIS